LSRAKNTAAIRMLILDVDGVLTDGRLYFGPRGEALTDFPFLASTGAMFRSSLDFYPDPRRLQGLAHAYAYWVARKIG